MLPRPALLRGPAVHATLAAALAAASLAAGTVALAGTASAATHTAHAAPVPHDPVGHVTITKTAHRTAEFSGWAIDRDGAGANVRIVELVDGYRQTSQATDLPKRSVSTKYAKYHASSTPAFDLTFTVPSDGRSHTACVGAKNIGSGTSTLLGCKTLAAKRGLPPAVSSHSPFGTLHSHRSGHVLQLHGRVTDPDYRSRRATVVVYVDGSPARTVQTQKTTKSHAAAVGANSAYLATARVSGGRAHIACVWAVDVGAGSNTLLGCRRYDLKSHATDRLTAHEATTMNRVVALAKKQFDKPYVFGAEGPHAFDCSGLVQWTYAKNGFATPRVAEDQYAASHRISASELRPGDLVLYYNHEGFVHHVGIYVRKGMTIAAMSPGLGIGYEPISQLPGWDGSYVSYGSFTHT